MYNFLAHDAYWHMYLLSTIQVCVQVHVYGEKLNTVDVQIANWIHYILDSPSSLGSLAFKSEILMHSIFSIFSYPPPPTANTV